MYPITVCKFLMKAIRSDDVARTVVGLSASIGTAGRGGGAPSLTPIYNWTSDLSLTLFQVRSTPKFDTTTTVTYSDICMCTMSRFSIFTRRDGIIEEVKVGQQFLPPLPQRLAGGAEAQQPPGW